ncbi:MAG: 2-hydroxyacid dehydrogenase [Burkholderiales bacterium]
MLTLLIKKPDNDGRLELIPDYLQTSWAIEVADPDDPDDMAQKLLGADAMISMSWKKGMPPAPRLRLFQLPGAGTDDIAFEEMPAYTNVCNVFEHEIGISEYVISAMLQWVIGIPKMDAALRRDEWWGSHLTGPRHGELHAQTLGIVGYGRIGQEVARRARAFGMNIIACSRTPRGADEFVASVAPMEQLPGLLGNADFVLLAMPLNSSTVDLIGTEQIALMKPTAVLINVSRGALINERSLFEACRRRQISGAIIDTWYHYPSQGNARVEPSAFPFRELDNVLMTPHSSGWTEGLRPRRCRVMAENLDRLARNEPLVNVVQKAVVPR